MPKAVAVIQGVVADANGVMTVNYSVAVGKENGTGINFSANAPAGVELTLAQWKAAARNKVVQDCASKGITLLTTDVVICGGPMA